MARSVWRWAPVLLFALLGAWCWIAAPGAAGGWLDRALDVGREWSRRGASPFGLLGPAEDPRVGPGAVLVRIGVSGAALDVLVRLFGLGFGILAVARLARGGSGAGAWLLAASPLWVESCVRGDPGVVLGLAFALLAGGSIPAGLAVALLAWALGWSPWAWALLLLPPLGWLAQPARRRAGAAVLLGALILMWLLSPPAAAHPLRWLEAIRRHGELSGLASGLAPFGTGRGGWPALGALHLPALAVLAWGARQWPARARRGDLAPLAVCASLALALPSGLAHAAPLLVVLPWAAGETGDALDRWRASASGGLRHLGRALPWLLLLPLLALGATRWTGRADAKGDRERALAWAESSFPAGSLMAFDAGLSPPDSSRLVWVGLPFHSLDPGLYRGAYWPGWFGACRGFVLSERIAQRYLDDAASPPEVLSFYEWARASAVEERAFGGPAGRRLRGLAAGVGARPALGEGWRDRVRRGAAEGLPGPFLAGLGGGLLRGGHAADGIALLEAAVDAGYTDIGLYLNLANGRLADGDVTEAGRVLEETVRRFPDSAEALYALGRVLVRVGYWQRAIPVLSGLRDRWPRFAPAAYLLGVALANAGQREAAATQLRGALELGLEEPQRSACREALDGLRGGNP